MNMTENEIIRQYREAKDKREQIKIPANIKKDLKSMIETENI